MYFRDYNKFNLNLPSWAAPGIYNSKVASSSMIIIGQVRQE